MILDETFHLKGPAGKVDFRSAMRIKHRPLFRACLARRDAITAARVGADDYVLVGDFFRLARLVRLVFRIVYEAIEKTHKTEVGSQRSEVEKGSSNRRRSAFL